MILHSRKAMFPGTTRTIVLSVVVAAIAALPASAASTNTVGTAVKWLVKQQKNDGSWRFAHDATASEGPFVDPEKLPSATKSTALVLLTLLGAGQTPEAGSYRKSVDRGIQFLLRSMRRDGDLRATGGMDAHALATIALCECYGLTKDAEYEIPAKQAIRFILSTQSEQHGSWSRNRRKRGDAVTTGWQLLALYCGSQANIEIPRTAVERARQFLGKKPIEDDQRRIIKSTRASLKLMADLLWEQKAPSPELAKQIDQLVQHEPAEHNLLYNYFTTIAIHKAGQGWKKWNVVQREHVLKRYIREGDQAGTWPVGQDVQARRYGPLYSTAMSLLILEVYYRHLLIYRL